MVFLGSRVFTWTWLISSAIALSLSDGSRHGLEPTDPASSARTRQGVWHSRSVSVHRKDDRRCAGLRIGGWGRGGPAGPHSPITHRHSLYPVGRARRHAPHSFSDTQLRMRIGLFTLGLGTAAEPEVIRAVAQTAERTGIATLWAAEHVVLFDRYESSYPYSPTGAFPLGAQADWLDPFVTLTFAAAVTSRIRLATGICLVPEHNPLILAKEIASLDRLAKGRFALGVGIGWSAEEFAALGVPFARRAQRTREYIEVMRRLWSPGVPSHPAHFLRFSDP